MLKISELELFDRLISLVGVPTAMALGVMYLIHTRVLRLGREYELLAGDRDFWKQMAIDTMAKLDHAVGLVGVGTNVIKAQAKTAEVTAATAATMNARTGVETVVTLENPHGSEGSAPDGHRSQG